MARRSKRTTKRESIAQHEATASSRNRRTQRRSRASRNLGFREGLTVHSAPSMIGTAPIVNDYRLSVAKHPHGFADGLRIDVSTALCQVGYAGNIAAEGSMIIGRGAASFNELYLTPSNDYYLSNALELLSASFTRYRMTKCVFKYRPTGAMTSQSVNLCFACDNDPCHPLVLSHNTAKFLDAGGFSFAAWRAWDYEMKIADTRTLQYVYQTGGVSPAYADFRVQWAGVFGLVTTTALTALAGPVGQLWLEGTFELFDLRPPFDISLALGHLKPTMPPGFVNLTAEEVRKAGEKRRPQDVDRTVLEWYDPLQEQITGFLLQPQSAPVQVLAVPASSVSSGLGLEEEPRHPEYYSAIGGHIDQEEEKYAPPGMARDRNPQLVTPNVTPRSSAPASRLK